MKVIVAERGMPRCDLGTSNASRPSHGIMPDRAVAHDNRLVCCTAVASPHDPAFPPDRTGAARPALLAAADAPSRARLWWADIAAIASDDTQGRQTGSPGYLKAADYVVSRLKALGLAPAGERGGYFQQVAFEEQRIDYPRSSAALVAPDGSALPVKLGEDMLITAGGGPRPAAVVDLNFDMPLPLWPLKTVLVQGEAESTLGATACRRRAPGPRADSRSAARSQQLPAHRSI